MVEYYTPVIINEYRSLQPLSLLITQAMFDASNLGFNWWNWGGTWQTQQGVYKFKSRWNTLDFEYNYYVKVNNKDLYFISKESLLKEYEGFYVFPFSKLKTHA